jgi:hypothetical protein
MDLFPWPWLYPFSPGPQYEIEPAGIYANSSLRFCKNWEVYPAQDWTLQYGLAPYAGTMSGPITFSSVPLNGGPIQLISVPPAITGQWKPGRYTWQCFALYIGTDTNLIGHRNYVSSGTIVVFADLTQPGSTDTRGPWQKIYDEILEMLLATSGDTQMEVSIGRGTIAGQTLKGWTKQELIAYADYALHMAGNDQRGRDRRGGAPNPRYKYAVMQGGGFGAGVNGFPLFPPVA